MKLVNWAKILIFTLMMCIIGLASANMSFSNRIKRKNPDLPYTDLIIDNDLYDLKKTCAVEPIVNVEHKKTRAG